MKRLPAFTLIEVLLSLLLVVLLGTFATIVLDGSLQDLGDQGQVAQQEQEMLWLCQGVRADMDRSAMVCVEADSALAFTIDGKAVQYRLKGGHLVRSSDDQERVCPLPIRSSSLEFVKGASSLVRIWTLSIGPNDELQKLTFRKEYDLRTIAHYHISDEHTDQQDH